jgi:hypothetical protein
VKKNLQITEKYLAFSLFRGYNGEKWCKVVGKGGNGNVNG